MGYSHQTRWVCSGQAGPSNRCLQGVINTPIQCRRAVKVQAAPTPISPKDDSQEALAARIASGQYKVSGSIQEKLTRPVRQALAKDKNGLGELLEPLLAQKDQALDAVSTPSVILLPQLPPQHVSFHAPKTQMSPKRLHVKTRVLSEYFVCQRSEYFVSGKAVCHVTCISAAGQGAHPTLLMIGTIGTTHV